MLIVIKNKIYFLSNIFLSFSLCICNILTAVYVYTAYDAIFILFESLNAVILNSEQTSTLLPGYSGHVRTQRGSHYVLQWMRCVICLLFWITPETTSKIQKYCELTHFLFS